MNETPKTPEERTAVIDEWRELLVDFGLPMLILIILTVLLICGFDSDIKSAFLVTIGWLVKGGISHKSKSKK